MWGTRRRERRRRTLSASTERACCFCVVGASCCKKCECGVFSLLGGVVSLGDLQVLFCIFWRRHLWWGVDDGETFFRAPRHSKVQIFFCKQTGWGSSLQRVGSQTMRSGEAPQFFHELAAPFHANQWSTIGVSSHHIWCRRPDRTPQKVAESLGRPSFLKEDPPLFRKPNDGICVGFFSSAGFTRSQMVVVFRENNG